MYWQPPPQKPGTPTWVIVVIVMVVVFLVLGVLAAIFYIFVGGLISSDGNTRPQVTFGSASAIINGFEFTVAGASRSEPASMYRVALAVNGTSAGSSQSLSSAMTIGSYSITWTDIGGEGELTGGDTFRVTRSPFPTNTDYVVTLLWIDGSAVGSRTYSS